MRHLTPSLESLNRKTVWDGQDGRNSLDGTFIKCFHCSIKRYFWNKQSWKAISKDPFQWVSEKKYIEQKYIQTGPEIRDWT